MAPPSAISKPNSFSICAPAACRKPKPATSLSAPPRRRGARNRRRSDPCRSVARCRNSAGDDDVTVPGKIAAAFDPAIVRKDFPILAREVYGKPLVYLDNGASAQKPNAVLDAMNDFASREYANVHRGVHYLSAVATDHYEAARETVRRFLNSASVDEIVFTKGGTESINLVSYAFLAAR